MIATRGLTKEYKGKAVVKDLNLHVGPGEIYGFLGPNGAGKSTTIKMILGLIQSTRGEIELFGQNLRRNYFELKQRIGVVGEFQNLYWEMTGQEYLKFFSGLYGLSDGLRRARQLMEELNLLQHLHLPLRAYSKGMQQKIALARALLHNPDLLILDEPVSSLDPQGIKLVRDIILRENQAGRTIFISSHLLSEIEKTCHRIGIINRGELLAEDTIAGVRDKLTEEMELELELEKVGPELVLLIQQLPYVSGVELSRGTAVIVRTQGLQDHRGDLLKHLLDHGWSVLSLQRRQLSLEEAFVTITDNNIQLLAGRGGSN